MLDIQKLCAGYGRTPVIMDIDLTVQPGEIVTLVGANGAGKSTLVKTISGLLQVHSGDILFQGESIAALPPSDRVLRGIAHVPEGRQVFAGMTVADNLRLGGYVHRKHWKEEEVQQRIRQVCELFPALLSRMTEVAANLSGGQQRAVVGAVAGAGVGDVPPDCVVAGTGPSDPVVGAERPPQPGHRRPRLRHRERPRGDGRVRPHAAGVGRHRQPLSGRRQQFRGDRRVPCRLAHRTAGPIDPGPTPPERPRRARRHFRCRRPPRRQRIVAVAMKIGGPIMPPIKLRLIFYYYSCIFGE